MKMPCDAIKNVTFAIDKATVFLIACTIKAKPIAQLCFLNNRTILIRNE